MINTVLQRVPIVQNGQYKTKHMTYWQHISVVTHTHTHTYTHIHTFTQMAGVAAVACEQGAAAAAADTETKDEKQSTLKMADARLLLELPLTVTDCMLSVSTAEVGFSCIVESKISDACVIIPHGRWGVNCHDIGTPVRTKWDQQMFRAALCAFYDKNEPVGMTIVFVDAKGDDDTTAIITLVRDDTTMTLKSSKSGLAPYQPVVVGSTVACIWKDDLVFIINKLGYLNSDVMRFTATAATRIVSVEDVDSDGVSMAVAAESVDFKCASATVVMNLDEMTEHLELLRDRGGVEAALEICIPHGQYPIIVRAELRDGAHWVFRLAPMHLV